MTGERKPWWVERVVSLVSPDEFRTLAIGRLWRLSEQLRFVRDNVDLVLLEADFVAQPHTRAVWARFLARELDVHAALRVSRGRLAGVVRNKTLGPAAFRTSWESLGFVPNDGDAGTPADDYLDGLLQIARFTLGDAAPFEGSPNMSSRAERTSDFLSVVEPGREDVVFDLGSGSGKLAITVGASTVTQVVGVEYGGSFVDTARSSAGELALENVRFIHADVRDVDLGQGSIFYLYYPFYGAVAVTVAERLGELARQKDITIYASGPANGYGEHFMRLVSSGKMVLSERRGQFGEVLVLRSNRA